MLGYRLSIIKTFIHTMSLGERERETEFDCMREGRLQKRVCDCDGVGKLGKDIEERTGRAKILHIPRWSWRILGSSR